MTLSQLKHLKELEAKATKGMWAAPTANIFRLYSWDTESKNPGKEKHPEPFATIIQDISESANWGMEEIKAPKECLDNLRLIAKSRNLLPALIAQVEKMNEDLKSIRTIGHNDDCIFCGFKDKKAKSAMLEG